MRERRTYLMKTGPVCPVCDCPLDIDYTPDVNHSLLCEECGATLKVVGLSPLRCEVVHEHEAYEKELRLHYSGRDWR